MDPRAAGRSVTDVRLTALPTRRWLLHEARRALAEALDREHEVAMARPDDPTLAEPAAAFVTWREGARLQGCLGTLAPDGALEHTVRTYAVRAGLHDPRTRPATVDLLPRLSCEISVLGPPRPMPAVGRAAIERALVPGRDGLVIHHGDRRAVFLPVVWTSLPEPQAFVQALCEKAGIDIRRHGDAITAETFGAEKFGDDAC